MKSEIGLPFSIKVSFEIYLSKFGVLKLKSLHKMMLAIGLVIAITFLLNKHISNHMLNSENLFWAAKTKI